MTKSIEQIEEEIEATKRTADNYRKAYRDGTISSSVFEFKMIYCETTISALRWVLGENDRY